MITNNTGILKLIILTFILHASPAASECNPVFTGHGKAGNPEGRSVYVRSDVKYWNASDIVNVYQVKQVGPERWDVDKNLPPLEYGENVKITKVLVWGSGQHGRMGEIVQVERPDKSQYIINSYSYVFYDYKECSVDKLLEKQPTEHDYSVKLFDYIPMKIRDGVTPVSHGKWIEKQKLTNLLFVNCVSDYVFLGKDRNLECIPIYSGNGMINSFGAWSFKNEELRNLTAEDINSIKSVISNK